MRLVVPLVVAMVPLLITPGLLSYFDVTPKIAVLLIGATLILLYRTENVHNLQALLSRPSGKWLAVLTAAQWLATGIATAFSTNPALSATGSNWRRSGWITETGLLLFALGTAAWLAANRENVRLLLRTIAASGALGAIYGIAQYFGWDPLLPSKAYQVGEGEFTIVRPPGTLGHADYFAAWLVVVVFLALALRSMEATRWLRMAAGIAAALAAVAILLSGTRSALVGLVCGAVVLLATQRPRAGIRSALAATLCVTALAVFFFSPAGARLRARVHWSREDMLGGSRLLLWRDSLRMAGHRPIAGFGPETFATDFARYESVDLARAYPEFYHESPHNIFLDALASRGILGLAVLLGFCWLGLQAIRRRNTGQPWMAPAAAGFAALLVAQQFIVFIAPTELYFFLLLGLLNAATSKPSAAPSRGAEIPRWTGAAALATSLLPAAFAIQLLVMDRALAVSYASIGTGDVKSAAAAYHRSLQWQPPGSGADLSYSVAMSQLASRAPLFATRIEAQQQAVEAGVRATRTAEDRHNAWYNLATLLAASNDAAAVEHSLRNALAWAPNWFRPHWALAQLFELTGHPREALAEAARAMEMSGGHEAEVVATWRRLQAQPLAQP